jgi:uncharacterized membrane protein
MRLAGHPVHPMLVHFPIVAWAAAVAMDLSIPIWKSPVLATIGFACVAVGLSLGVLAMLAGFIDYTELTNQHPAQKSAVAHMSMMGTAWLLFLISLTLRGFAPHRAGPWLWTTSADIAGFVVMLLGAWRGANLVYHFRVGVDGA